MPDRIYAQYRDKPKAVKWYNIVPTMASQIDDVYEAVRTSYNIDTNVGEQLDVIGRIVDIDRSYEAEIDFEVDTQYGSTSTESQYGGVNAQYNTTGSSIDEEVSDSIFRILIRAKIAKNNNEATLDGIVDALLTIVDVEEIRVIDNEDMTFSISFGSELTDVERFVFNTFDVIPRPQGVGFLGYVEETNITQFGGDLGFGDSRAGFGKYFGA